MLARAERLHRQFFQPARAVAQLPTWEPPVDVIETEREVLVLVALPEVDPIGSRPRSRTRTWSSPAAARFRPSCASAVIHRLELPQGRFARRVRLPGGRYESIRRSATYGCLLITLLKTGTARG